MNVQQLFYILGSVYIILSLAVMIAVVIGILILVKQIRTTKRRWEAELRNRKVVSSKTFKAVLPLLFSLGTSWGLNKLKNTLTNR